MPLSNPINIRLEQTMLDQLQDEAVLHNKTVTQLIREKLAYAESVGGELADLRRAVDAEFVGLHNRLDDLGGGSHEGSPGAPLSIQYETLLLLRKMGGVPAINYAHKEMNRLGVPIYNPDKIKN